MLDFKCKKKNIEDKKIINGSNSRIKVGAYDSDKINGSDTDAFKFLKNSISSNKFNKIPNAKKIKIVLKTILKKLITKYLLIILLTKVFSHKKYFL